MKIQGIQSIIRRKKKKYAYAPPDQVAENLLNRKFYAEASNEKWLTNVTEFEYGNGQKAYLSAILNLHDNVIVSYEMGGDQPSHISQSLRFHIPSFNLSMRW